LTNPALAQVFPKTQASAPISSNKTISTLSHTRQHGIRNSVLLLLCKFLSLIDHLWISPQFKNIPDFGIVATLAGRLELFPLAPPELKPLARLATVPLTRFSVLRMFFWSLYNVEMTTTPIRNLKKEPVIQVKKQDLSIEQEIECPRCRDNTMF
jgi:hypothetical protein